ncbi:MAG: hypothetical protein E6Q97_15285 [Desulfurellales bacterium]|nr:MAG: hypothetical protein E6Q97_15285 [Desulfurellales bacterium]
MTTNAQTYQELFMPTPAGFANWLASARKTIHEEGIIDFVSKLSPWIAPLPSAWFVHDATVRHLAAGSGLAWIIAIVIETLGLTTTHTALGMHAWNKTHANQPEKQAPFGLAVILAIVYVIATLLLISVLEVKPEWQHYAPAMFPLLAVVGAVNLALRSHHNNRIREERNVINDEKQRQREIEDEERAQKLEEKRLRALAKYGVTVNPATVNQNVNLPVSTPVNYVIDGHNDSQNDGLADKLIAGKRSKIDARRDQLVEIVRSDPTIELAELQRRLGLGSVNTVKTDIEHLIAFGRIRFENRVFEVL